MHILLESNFNGFFRSKEIHTKDISEKTPVGWEIIICGLL